MQANTHVNRQYGLNVPVFHSDWSTSNQKIGVGYHDVAKVARAQGSRPAGVTTYESGYVQAAHEFPRYERQKIRAIYDEAIASGARQPHPELLRRYPNREIPPADSAAYPDRTCLRSGGSGRSRRSGRSEASRRSAASLAGKSIAGSEFSRASRASSGPPPGYMRQIRTPTTMYTATSEAYGAGGFVGREPHPGRETWLMGRGGGQGSSFDNCLVEKGRYAPVQVSTCVN
eukprot:TRINITY_DN121053_c0_g1_i1.p2 TRINITY_DN121053_c0_g1~~TRINITY_DN121053_c0_g1_i1.p2  ORF type:complete len:230 (+),score=18.85 TRINITY_DN121053_c0_g1_i1:183-872(+)